MGEYITDKSTETKLYKKESNLLIRSAQIGNEVRISDYYKDSKEFFKLWEPKRDLSLYSREGWRKRLVNIDELHRTKLEFYNIILDSKTGEMLGMISFYRLVRFPLTHAASAIHSVKIFKTVA